MVEESSSYKHEDESVELERLIKQFHNDWKWEKVALLEFGFRTHQPTHIRALSYGCGSGIDAFTLLKEGFVSYVEGWDISLESVQEATKRFGNEQLVFRQVNLINDNPIPNITGFNLVYLRLVLLHIPFNKISELLKKCYNLLNEGGYLLVHDTDKERQNIIPSEHEFNLIIQEINQYLIRHDNNPRVGSLIPQILDDLGFKSIQSKTIFLETSFEDTKDDLSYSINIKDETRPNGKLIPQTLWDKACSNNIPNFKRTTFRIITIGQK